MVPSRDKARRNTLCCKSSKIEQLSSRTDISSRSERCREFHKWSCQRRLISKCSHCNAGLLFVLDQLHLEQLLADSQLVRQSNLSCTRNIGRRSNDASRIQEACQSSGQPGRRRGHQPGFLEAWHSLELVSVRYS